MKPLTEREIHDLLTVDTPEPPAGLAEAIKREIPAEIALAPDAGPGDAKTTPMPRSRVWLMAASVAMAVGGGFLALRFMERLPEAPETAAAATPAEPRTEPRTEPPAEPRADGTESTSEASDAVLDDASSVAGRLSEPAPAGEKKSAAEQAEGRASSGRRTAAAEPVIESAAEAGERADERAQRNELRKEHERLQKEALQQRTRELGGQAADATVSVDLPPPPPPLAPQLPKSKDVPKPRAERIPAPKSSARVQGQNLRVEEGNQQIRSMEAEARKLEEELKKLEEGEPALRVAPSTGGTAEPNDAPYGDVFFEGPGTNPFIDTEDDAQSTFGLDVDTGSYTVGRRYLSDGHLPPPESVRPEEYVNYFDYRDPAPEADDEFAIHAEGAPSIYGEGERYYLLRFNLSGREIDDEDRRPALLTFVVDVSGSMGRENRLGLVKRALALLLDQLTRDDQVALVVYGSRGRVVLAPTSDLGAIRRAVDGLRTEGATNAEEGLTLAYDLAARHRREGAINRVILCSDGVANVGRTSASSILERIRREADRGIELTTVGFGMGNYNDTMMERLADDGNGRYAYVDTLDEARRIFVENLTGTLQTLAAEARVQVEFDSRVVSRYRLVGYENRDIADERFRDDTVDAGEIGVGHTVTALYEIKTHDRLRPRDRVATLHLRYGSVARGEMVEISRAVTGADFARRWDDASPALQLTSLVAEYAEILKRAYWAREGDLGDVFRRAQKVSGRFAGDHEVADFVSLVGKAARAWERQAER